jgi:hypothetical protein
MVADPTLIKASVAVRVSRLAQGLRSGAKFLEFVAVVSIAGGVVLGIVVASQTSTTLSQFGSGSNTHPYVGSGIAIMVGALVGGIFYWCVARALRLFAEHVATAHGVDLDGGFATIDMDDDEDDDDDEDEDDETSTTERQG